MNHTPQINSMQNRKLFLLLGLCLILAVSFISSQIENIGTAKQNTCINLPQSSNSSTFCNITSIQYPDKTTNFTQLAMTKQGTNYNYTFCQTSNLNEYIVNGFCNADGVWAYNFTVTPTGDSRGFGIWIALIICAFILFTIDYFVETGYLTFLSGILFVVTGVYGMIYGIGDLSEFYTRALSLVTIGVGIIFMIGAAYDLVWGRDEDDNGGGYEED